jgi:hypothetical protein
MADLDELPDAEIDPNDPMGDFASWIPRYSKPEDPCNYCRTHQLECFMTFEGQTTCSPCNALFRACSFNQPRSRLPKGAIDTLHVVDENVCAETGDFTKYKHLRSLGGPSVDPSNDPPDERQSGAKSGARFSRHAVKILRDWIEEHSHHPYPTEEEKEELRVQTGLSISQVSNWLANARRRGKARPKRAPSPGLRASTPAVDLPRLSSSKEWDHMNPFDRWRYSPPENEPAPVNAIKDAMKNVRFDSALGTNGLESPGSKHCSGENSSAWSQVRAASSTSLDTSFMSSGSYSGSHHSHGSGYSRDSRSSYHSFGSIGKKQKRRRRVPPKPAKPETANTRPFQCTFCTDSFKSKYDWVRHEKSLHISLEKWICAPYGGISVDPNDGQRKCSYCNLLNPSPEHLEEHNHDACESKGIEARTFYRKDHLRQHLRLMHNCKLTPAMEHWKSELAYVASRCGFCGERFTKWQARVDHLAKHFRNGSKMQDWKGCRGLDPLLAAQVTNAMPPYLIAGEATTLHPFSASRRETCQFLSKEMMEKELLPSSAGPTLSSIDTPSELSGLGKLNIGDLEGGAAIPTTQILEGSSSAFAPSDVMAQDSGAKRYTCWEVLTIRLGGFVRDHVAQFGVPPSDLQLQDQARWIIYESDDPWNQTSADNSEWLTWFKRAHDIADTANLEGSKVPSQPASVEEKADLLEDLGIGAGIDLSELGFEAEFPPVTTGEEMHGDHLAWRTPSGLRLPTSGPFINPNDDMSGFSTF